MSHSDRQFVAKTLREAAGRKRGMLAVLRAWVGENVRVSPTVADLEAEILRCERLAKEMENGRQ